MNLRKKLLASVIFFCGLTSCTFRVPQAENALRQIQTFVVEESSGEEVLWLASFRGKGAVLKPFSTEGYIVFANESGDAVAFDGWVVRSVLGFGMKQAITTSDDGWIRSSRSEGKSFVAACSEWQREATGEGYQWRQICGINEHETIISIDEAGSIRSIRQMFGGGLGTLTLNLRR